MPQNAAVVPAISAKIETDKTSRTILARIGRFFM
jgi:hypothetical protein